MCSLYSISNQQPKKLSYNPLSWKSLPAEGQEHCKLGLMHQVIVLEVKVRGR